MGCRPVVLGVVLVKAISILVHTSARGAACGSVSVVPPSAGVRSVSAHLPHASPRPSLGAPAQPAHAGDAAARPRDRGVFEMENRPEVSTDLSVAAHLMGNPLGRTEEPSQVQ